MRTPVIENYIRFVQLTLEFGDVNLRRETNIVTEPAFRRLHCTVGRAVRAAIRAVSLFNYARAGFDWNSRWECKTLSAIHLESKTKEAVWGRPPQCRVVGQDGRRDGGRDKALFSLEGRRRAEEDGW